jgi:hypothetical protein
MTSEPEHQPGCHLCEDPDVPTDPQGLLDHLRVMHPDVYGDGPERWPDGGIVIHEEPSDLEGLT